MLKSVLGLLMVFGMTACQFLQRSPSVNSEYIPRKVLSGNPDMAGLTLSPDGKYVAYLAEHKGVLNIWVQDFGKPESARAVTHDEKRGIFEFSWTYAPGTLVFNQDLLGDENAGLYTLDVATGKQTEIAAPGKSVNYVVSRSHLRPKEVVVMSNARDPKYFDYKILNLETKAQTELFTNTQNFASVLFDINYHPVIGTISDKDGGSTWHLWNAKAKKFEKKTKISFEDNMATRPLAVSHDGDSIYLMDNRGRDTAALVLWNLKTDKIQVLAENTKSDLSNIQIDAMTGKPQWIAFNYLKSEHQFFDESAKAHFAELEKKLETDIEVESMSLDGRQWVIITSDPARPAAYHYYDTTTKKLSEPMVLRKALLPYADRLSKMEAVEIKSRDGLTLVSYLTKPQKPAGKSMVLLVHGGPWHRDSYEYNRTHQWLADRGYHVLSVNFRSSTGLGKKFLNAGDGQWGRKMHDDLIDAVNWAIEKGYADKDKVVIMGGSYGGYSALAGVTFTPDVFAAAIDIVGPSNLETLLETVPPYWESFRANLHRRVGDPATAAGRALLKERSPLNYVDKIKRPLQIQQGANDPRVKKAEADQIFNAMLAKNIPVEYVLFPDEGHGFYKAENNLGSMAVSEEFLAKHLGGRLEPIEADVKASSAQFITTKQ